MTNPTGKGGNPKSEIDKQQSEDMHDEQLLELVLPHASKAIDVLAEIAFSEDADPADRVAAASAILDLGWGKPGVAVEAFSEAVLASDNTPGEDEEPTSH